MELSKVLQKSSRARIKPPLLCLKVCHIISHEQIYVKESILKVCVYVCVHMQKHVNANDSVQGLKIQFEVCIINIIRIHFATYNLYITELCVLGSFVPLCFLSASNPCFCKV